MSISQAMLFTGAGEVILNDATGGTITRSGDFQYHVFTSTGNLNFTKLDGTSGNDLSYALVAGGSGATPDAATQAAYPNSDPDCGQSGWSGGSGSGGGSYRIREGTIALSTFSINTNYQAVVGAGQPRGNIYGVGASSFRGNSSDDVYGGAYGSGGAGACDNSNAPNGNAGSAGYTLTLGWSAVGVSVVAGGGGGGGGGSKNGTAGLGGNGGNGGGGAGGEGGNGGDGAGGEGGAANTGGAGGGGGGAGSYTVEDTFPGLGGVGGSGIVIVKFKYK